MVTRLQQNGAKGRRRRPPHTSEPAAPPGAPRPQSSPSVSSRTPSPHFGVPVPSSSRALSSSFPQVCLTSSGIPQVPATLVQVPPSVPPARKPLCLANQAPRQKRGVSARLR